MALELVDDDGRAGSDTMGLADVAGVLVRDNMRARLYVLPSLAGPKCSLFPAPRA